MTDADSARARRHAGPGAHLHLRAAGLGRAHRRRPRRGRLLRPRRARRRHRSGRRRRIPATPVRAQHARTCKDDATAPIDPTKRVVKLPLLHVPGRARAAWRCRPWAATATRPPAARPAAAPSSRIYSPAGGSPVVVTLPAARWVRTGTATEPGYKYTDSGTRRRPDHARSRSRTARSASAAARAPRSTRSPTRRRAAMTVRLEFGAASASAASRRRPRPRTTPRRSSTACGTRSRRRSVPHCHEALSPARRWAMRRDDRHPRARPSTSTTGRTPPGTRMTPMPSRRCSRPMPCSSRCGRAEDHSAGAPPSVSAPPACWLRSRTCASSASSSVIDGERHADAGS